MELQQLRHDSLAEETLAGARAHRFHGQELHVLGDQFVHRLDDFVGVFESVEDFGGHAGADTFVAVEADAVRFCERWRFADVVEEDAPGLGDGRFVEAFHHHERVGPDVAFGVEVRGLADALECLYFGEDLFEQVEFVEEFEASAGMGLRQDAGDFVADAFGGYGLDLRAVGADGVGGGGFDFEFETGGETDGS